MKNEVKISVAELKSMLLNWNYGTMPASVQYVTEPKMNAANKKAFPTLVKIANVGGLIGAIYENSVNNQLEREEKERCFVSKPLWNGKGKRINTVLSTHIEKETFYLTFKPQTTYRSIFLDTLNLVSYSYSEIKNFLIPSQPAKNQGVNEGNEVRHNEINLQNIRRIKFKNTTYVVSPTV